MNPSRRRPTCRVYIGGLPSDTRVSDIERFFKNYARRIDILLKRGFAFIVSKEFVSYNGDLSQRIFLSLVIQKIFWLLFQEFDDYRDADDAIHDLNGKELLGTRITVEHARGPRREGGGRRDGDRRRAMWVDKYGPPTRTKYRVIVENLSTKMSWQVIL